MTSCVDRLAPPERVLCNSNHCDSFQQTSDFHAICNCIDWQGNTIPNCDARDNLYPVHTGQCVDRKGNYLPLNNDDCFTQGYQWKACYCCCSCFAAKTPVAVPTGMQAIGDINIGDQVQAAARDGQGWTWSAQTVHFSSGSPPSVEGGGNLMIMIMYGSQQWLTASPNQLFLLAASGKLKRADQLVPGVDQLVGPDGGGVTIHKAISGNFIGAVHHIATAVPSYDQFDGEIDNHLINVNGIISGDYLLQLYQDTAKMQDNLASPTAPVIGTPAYQSAHPAAHTDRFSAGAAPAGLNHVVSQFAAHSASTTVIPADAAALFTLEQEAQLLDPDIGKRALSDDTNRDISKFYFKLFSSFYPELRCYLDWTSTRANVFAFEEFGQKTIVVGGELLRLEPLYGEAMAVVVAFGAASLLATPGAYASRGRAMYYGMGVLARTVLRGGDNWSDTMITGSRQLGGVIKALMAKDDGGDSAAELSCLLSVMNAAISGEELPTCAGGPVQGSLKLLAATYDAAASALMLSFNQKLSPFTATNPKNYRLTPLQLVTAVKIADTDPQSVVLTVTLPPKQYRVAVANVRAADGSTLDPSASSVTLTVAPA